MILFISGPKINQNFYNIRSKIQVKIVKKKTNQNNQVSSKDMQNNQSQQFHHFIELSAHKRKQAQKFPEFEYMEQTIRKSYKQLKKSKGDKTVRPNQKFTQYFKNLQKQQQIKYYQKSLKLLQISISQQISLEKRKEEIQKLKKQGQAYIKKSIINKWQKKNIKLSHFNFYIYHSKKERTYPLKYYAIRKSKNKQHYGWVLQVLNDNKGKNIKTIHCGVRNIKDFEQWFELLDKSIDLAKINQYRTILLGLSPQQDQIQSKKEKRVSENHAMKTLTELVIDNQMKIIEQRADFQEPRVQQQPKEIQNQSQKHPNVFKRLFSQIDLTNFTQNSVNMNLIQNGPGYRLFDMNPYPGQDFRLRINILLSSNKSLVFKALNEQMNLWNNQIDIFSIKTKISSQNSALVYQKDKSQGLLYRQRDYLYFRHCFSIKATSSNEKNKIFIADKSIDSINFPPFMTVARGQKKLVFCIYGNEDQKQSMLIVEGQIKGGGYMNSTNDRQMTIKFMKKLAGLESYLKQKNFIQGNQKGKQMIFQENWEVQKEEEQFYDIQNQSVSSEDQSIEAPQEKQKAKQQQQKNRKFSSTSDQQHTQFDQFIKKTSQENLQGKQNLFDSNIIKQDALTFSQIFAFTTPEFNSDKTIIIPQNHLKAKHAFKPLEKSKNPSFFPHYRGHHLWKGQWAVCPTGGLNYVDQQKMNEQKKVLTFIIKRIGKNILSGKGILNISLPVDIFCRQSNIQRLAASFGFAPQFLQKAAHLQDPSQQLKHVIATANFSSLIYLTMQKPFNPILGQTYQSWIDGCPIYFQQISHHPPIAAYMMIGRGYRLSGTMQAKMDLSINSGSGYNQGIFSVEFDNGKKFYYTTAVGQLSGLTYGERKLLFIGKTYYWSIQQGLFLELQFNPSSKNRRFFGGSNASLTGDAIFHDFYEGVLKKYKKQDLQQFFVPKKGDFRKNMAIPKSIPNCEPLSQIYKVTGRWTKYIAFNNQKLYQVDDCRYYSMKDELHPLPSHSNYRQDVVYRRLNNFVLSQQYKQVLQVKQRKDKKLRQANEKNKK